MINEFAAGLLARARDDAAAVRAVIDVTGVTDAIVGFHAQQAVEKSVKAVLASREQSFPLTHDLEGLLERCGQVDVDVPAELERSAGLLTPYAVRRSPSLRRPSTGPRRPANCAVARHARRRVGDGAARLLTRAQPVPREFGHETTGPAQHRAQDRLTRPATTGLQTPTRTPTRPPKIRRKQKPGGDGGLARIVDVQSHGEGKPRISVGRVHGRVGLVDANARVGRDTLHRPGSRR